MFNVDFYYLGLFLMIGFVIYVFVDGHWGIRLPSFSLGPSVGDLEVGGVAQPWFMFYPEPLEPLIQPTGV